MIKPSRSRNNRSKIAGITWSNYTKKWRVDVYSPEHLKSFYIGVFKTIEQAKMALEAATIPEKTQTKCFEAKSVENLPIGRLI